MAAHAIISKSRSNKKPFKVVLIGENGEPLQSAQLFTTRLNCRKNLIAVVKACNGKFILVKDRAGIEEKVYTLHCDGLEQFVS